MSGLVDILDVVWVDQNDALMFVVRTTDVNGTIFRSGALRGDSISRHWASGQSLLVTRTRTTVRRNTHARAVC